MLVLSVTELATALAGLCVWSTLIIAASRHYWRSKKNSKSPEPTVSEPAYLFIDNELVDATALGYQLLEQKPDRLSDWDCLTSLLGRDFPHIRSKLEAIEDAEKKTFFSDSNPSISIHAERMEDMFRVKVSGTDDCALPEIYQQLETQSRNDAFEMLQDVAESAPQLMWQLDADQRLVWANRAYLRCSDKLHRHKSETPKAWPAEPIFEGLPVPEVDAKFATQSRHSIQFEGEKVEHWFNVASMPGATGTLHFASDANEQVKAEFAQKAFLQTFSKTFAELSVGLAIFNRKKVLTMFNPALMELTGLPFNFLSSQPNISSVLNRMRDARKIPEPKDFPSWREQLTNLLDKASNGAYQEIWNLPDGQAYRVSGRPHPDGALAFIFEDISAEISLTRRFRTEIQTSQAVLDTLADAVAVFSPSNTLITTNAAYDELWGANETQFDRQIELRDALRIWKSGCAPSSLWRSIEAHLSNAEDRKEWSKSILLNDGRSLECEIHPITGGLVMVKFVQTKISKPVIQKLTQGDLTISASRQ